MPALVLCLVCLAVGRGLLRPEPLAGHDAAAYPVTLQQFHLNLQDGVGFPRWSPDTRFGHGQPLLQYRPPLLQYLAEPVYLASGNFSLGVNLAVALLVFVAGFGMRAYASTFLRPWPALAAATAYLAFNYYLGDLYVRGAYYEVAAYAFMPWVLWAQAALFRRAAAGGPLLAGAAAWAGLLCGHPQIAALFAPLAFAHALWLWGETRNGGRLALAAAQFACGVSLSAPYVLVAAAETPWVRLELFLGGLETYYRHFLSGWNLLLEPWPSTYVEHSWQDYLGRPRSLEARGLNWWLLPVAATVVALWATRRFTGGPRRRSLFFAAAALAAVVMASPVSVGVWRACPLLHTFNFPWRSLAVAGLCLAALAGIATQWAALLLPSSWRAAAAALPVAVVVVLGGDAWSKSGGWPCEPWAKAAQPNSETIRLEVGIPLQYYTPAWVGQYAAGPAAEPVQTLEGKATAKLLRRSATRWEIEVDAATPARLMVAHYFYPGWKVLEQGKEAVAPEIVHPQGTMAFTVPAGKQVVALVFGSTPARRLADALCAAGLAAALLMAGLLRKGRRTGV